MANDDHLTLLKQDVAAWNAWRKENPDTRPDLREADLSGADLREADLSDANLRGAVLREANFRGADLRGAAFIEADLSETDLSGADLRGTHFKRADLSGADLRSADLEAATLVDVDLTGADLTGSRVYGVSAWGLRLERVKQQNLVIAPRGEPEITVDNIEVAQFIYLMLHNQKIRDVIIDPKTVLILGHFTDERKAFLDALCDELRKRDLLAIVFDFNVRATRDIAETVRLLARVSRFIIADLTHPSSIPTELQAIVPGLLAGIVPGLAVPVQPLIEGSSRPFAMFEDLLRKYEWVLPLYRYEGVKNAPLIGALVAKAIAPAEAKFEAGRIAKERKDAILEGITSRSKEYAVAFDPEAAELRTKLSVADRIELENLVEELSGAKLESQAGAVVGAKDAMLRRATENNRVEIDYLIDPASHRIRITSVRQGVGSSQASFNGPSHA